MSEFILGYTVTGMILMRIVGGIAAVASLALITAIFLVIAGALFDAITSRVAKRWVKSGRKPRNRLERIIMRSQDSKE